MRAKPSPPTLAAAGFTLVELLVTVLLFTLVMGAALGLLSSQRNLTDMAAATISVQANMRAALDLVASDLRTIPDDAVLTGNGDSVVVRLPYRWGLICSSTGTGSPPPDAHVYIPSEGLFAGADHAGVAVRDTAGVWTHWDDTSEPWDDSLSVGSTVACLDGPADTVEVGDTAQASYRRWSDFYTYTGTEADAGAQIMAYSLITYRFDDSTFEPGTRAIYRVTSSGAQELAGLFDEDAGFEYILDDGTEHTVLPVGRQDEVAQIRILARGAVRKPYQHRGGGGGNELSYDATVSVHLRNSGVEP